jgi:hypothetical protein
MGATKAAQEGTETRRTGDGYRFVLDRAQPRLREDSIAWVISRIEQGFERIFVTPKLSARARFFSEP